MSVDWKRIPAVAVALGLGVFVALLAGCGGDDDPGRPVAKTGTCLSCHQDADALQATANPEPPDTGGDSGEG